MRSQKHWGAALALVLLVLSFLIVVGFALADLSVIQVQMARQYLTASRAKLLAQAAVRQFMDVFDRASQRVRTNALDLESGGPTDLGLRAAYSSGEGLPNRAWSDLDGTVEVSFDTSRPFYSTDNSLSEYSAAGWCDRGLQTRSIPPFSVDLLVNVLVDGTQRHFEAVVMRRWPFAAFTERGLIVICGTPLSGGTSAESTGSTAPSLVSGAVATLERNPPFGTMDLTPSSGAIVMSQTGTSQYVNLSAPATTTSATLQAAIRALAAWEGSRYGALADAAVTVGPTLTVQTPPQVNAAVPLGAPNGASSTLTPFGGGPTLNASTVTEMMAGTVAQNAQEAGNVLNGDVFVSDAFQPVDVTLGTLDGVSVGYSVKAVDASPDNTFSGQVLYSRFPSGLSETRNPVEDARFPMDVSGYVPIPRPPLPQNVMDQLATETGPDLGDPNLPASSAADGAASFGFLFGTLTLDPDLPTRSPLQFGDAATRFCFQGDLGNRFIAPVKTTTPSLDKPLAAPTPAPTPTFTVFESPGGISLHNSILFVNGNLDLSANSAPGSQVGINGSNSTLIVNGTLALNGGHLDSIDQGMVILARDIVLRASGDYRGLILAKNSLTILPAADDGAPQSALNIHGAILCGHPQGGLILRSVHLTYDAAYMKGVHEYGQAVCTFFRALK